MITVSSMSRYVLDQYYKKAGVTGNEEKDLNSSLNDLQKATRDNYNGKTVKYSDSYAALISMGSTGKNNLAKKTADSSGALANSSMSLVSPANYSYAYRGSTGVNEGIVGKVKQFVEDYNSTINTVKNSDNVNALRYGVSMVDTTKAFKKSLAKVGITIKDNNNLEIDEEKLKNANVNDVKKLFSGNYSYGSRMVSRSLGMNFAAKSEVKGTYNSAGQMNNYSNPLYTILNSMA